ncbi:MAG: hypothetical protein CUN55_09450 [Phototrophicales bacterium]|nr:MAG: hypothetical protein CUN55_09450 [Phototrophicales bacterium]
MKKLLIIDDEAATVEMLSMFLQISGYSTLEAYAGDEGLVLAKLESPSLIISDLMMPDIDGIELCRRVREHEALKDLPIIIISARTDSTVIEQAMANGANAYLTKPIDLSQLIGEIERLLT